MKREEREMLFLFATDLLGDYNRVALRVINWDLRKFGKSVKSQDFIEL